MKITVFGSGYVGLVAAACFASAGHVVRCLDIDEERVQRLRAGDVPFFEPGLEELVKAATMAKRLSFGVQLEADFANSDVFFIAVGTPPLSSGRADVSAVLQAAETIALLGRNHAVVCVKSTVPVGTCDAVQKVLERARPGCTFFVASVPEFLKEGSALEDFFKPDRVVVGTESPLAERVLRDLYRTFLASPNLMIVMDRRSAELAKYAANALLASRISFMNEMSRLCDKIGADVHNVRRAIGTDRRIGREFLYAGPGFGGACFPKDVHALEIQAEDVGSPMGMVRATRAANEAQRAYVVDRARDACGGSFKGKVVAIWGLAFKPNTDDARMSPAAPLTRAVMNSGGTVRAYDPEAAHNFAQQHLTDLDESFAMFLSDEYDAAKGADLLVLMTEWRHLRFPDIGKLAETMRTRVVLDARNVLDGNQFTARGFSYFGIGTRVGRLQGAP